MSAQYAASRRPWRWGSLLGIVCSLAGVAGAQVIPGARADDAHAATGSVFGGRTDAPFGGLPFPARIQMLLEDGEIAGRPVTVAAFQSVLAPAELVQRLRGAWSGDARRPWLQSRADPWSIASRQSPSGTLTLQYRAGATGGSQGLVSFWPRPGRRQPGPGAGSAGGADPLAYRSAAERVAELTTVLPEDSAVTETVSRDGSRRTITVLARSSADPGGAWGRLAARLRAQGYEARRGADGGQAIPHTRFGVFARRDREILATLDARGASLGIVLQLTEMLP